MEHDFQRTAQLAESYLAVYTNDYRGWRILGAASTMLDQNVRALDAYRRATKLGDETGYTPMARAALELNRLDVVSEISPQLLRLRHSKALPTVVNLDAVGLFMIYARLSDDREVFLKTLEGMKAEDIVPRDDVTSEVNKACKKFQAAEVDVLCQKVNEAVERKATEQKK